MSEQNSCNCSVAIQKGKDKLQTPGLQIRLYK